jgi:hypothetical protein
MRSGWDACRLAIVLAVLVVFIPLGSASLSGDDELRNPLCEHLLRQGVALADRQHAPLSPFTLPDGIPGDAVEEFLEPIHQRHGWNRFTRNSHVAPVELKLGTVADAAGKRLGHTVSVWFVAYGSLESLTDPEMLTELAGDIAAEQDAESNEALTGGELTDDRLARMGIERLHDARLREVFVEARFPILNRVEVAGVSRVVSSYTEQSLVVAWELDPRFSQGESPANHWQPMERTDLGEKKRGAARAYQGYGGYGKITALSEPEGALFVECHVVFHEPEEWFAGSNALRAKIPLGVQENVRKFRRQLARRDATRSNP